MSRICRNCGAELESGQRFCSICGANAPEEEEQAVTTVQQENYQYQQSYQQPDQNVYQQQGTYQQQNEYNGGYNNQGSAAYSPYANGQESHMTTKQWLGTIVVTTFFGIISLIFLFIWAFDGSTNIEKKNYCRGMLIAQAILLGVSILTFIIIFSVIAMAVGSVDSWLRSLSLLIV